MLILRSSPAPSEIDEEPARARLRRSWRERLRPACRGIKLGVRGHSRFFVHFFCSALVLVSAVVLRCDLVQWCLLLGCIGIVFITELFSSALVALYRGLDSETRNRTASCLDIATGAVFLATLTAGAIGGLVFVSRLIEMCAPALAE